jgi:hypothetical protein
MNAAPAIAAIRAVRLAAHELASVCASIVGGTEMAISLPSVPRLGDDPREVEPDEDNIFKDKGAAK